MPQEETTLRGGTFFGAGRRLAEDPPMSCKNAHKVVSLGTQSNDLLVKDDPPTIAGSAGSSSGSSSRGRVGVVSDGTNSGSGPAPRSMAFHDLVSKRLKQQEDARKAASINNADAARKDRQDRHVTSNTPSSTSQWHAYDDIVADSVQRALTRSSN